MKAVIDIGTNSVLLLVARRAPDGRIDVVHDEARITRLGQGVAQTRELAPDAIVRTLDVLGAYAEVARKHGAVLDPVATEGLRMAENRDVFLEGARERLGTAVRMISGEEEAELSYQSVAQELEPGTSLHVLDIGGGSTELVVGRGRRIEQRCSHKVGSVRWTERFVTSDPPSAEAVAQMESAAREALASQPVAPLPELHALAGTATTSGALMLGLETYDRERVDGSRFSRVEVRVLRDALASETLEQRLERPCLEPGRADVIVAGLSIMCAAIDHCGAETLVVRDRGVRFGLV